jgi:hypothetical protein
MTMAKLQSAGDVSDIILPLAFVIHDHTTAEKSRSDEIFIAYVMNDFTPRSLVDL